MGKSKVVDRLFDHTWLVYHTLSLCAHLDRSADAEFDDDEEFDLSDIEEAGTTDIHVNTAEAAGEAAEAAEVGEMDDEEEIVADDSVNNDDEVCY